MNFPTFLILIFTIPLVSAVPEVYTAAESKALNELVKEMRKDLYLDHHKNPRYLINWLRNKNLNVAETAVALRTSLKYRQENDIESVLVDEKMHKFRKSYPASFGASVDNLGNPAYQVAFSQWDIRQAMLQGKKDQLFRYVFFIFESSMKAARDRDATNFIFFADMSNYNLRTHACLACIPYYVHLVSTYEGHYPNSARYVIAINTPRMFEAVSNIMLPLMSPHTQKVYKIFGSDKAEWQKFVLEVFSEHELTKQFGGIK